LLEHDGSPNSDCLAAIAPVTLALGDVDDDPDGNAALEIRDLWFDAKTCAVGPGGTQTIPLRAVAGKTANLALRDAVAASRW
jgi:hypothetical protein